MGLLDWNNKRAFEVEQCERAHNILELMTEYDRNSASSVSSLHVKHKHVAATAIWAFIRMEGGTVDSKLGQSLFFLPCSLCRVSNLANAASIVGTPSGTQTVSNGSVSMRCCTSLSFIF